MILFVPLTGTLALTRVKNKFCTVLDCTGDDGDAPLTKVLDEAGDIAERSGGQRKKLKTERKQQLEGFGFHDGFMGC